MTDTKLPIHLEALKDTKACPLWHDQDIRPAELPALATELSCDLLVVGGGFTGLWGALQAKERKPEADIILIDQTFIGDGASGRCGGFLRSSLAHGETNSEYQFPGESDKLALLGNQNMAELIETLERYNIDAHYEKVGEMSVALDQEAVKRLRLEYETDKADGDDVIWFDEKAVQAEVHSATFLAGLWEHGGQDGVIDPARLCWGLKETLLTLGIRIFENTKLLGIEEVGSTAMKATCETGVVVSKKILMATNAFRNPIAKIRRSVLPIWDYQIATEPLTDEQLEKIGWHK